MKSQQQEITELLEGLTDLLNKANPQPEDLVTLLDQIQLQDYSKYQLQAKHNNNSPQEEILSLETASPSTKQSIDELKQSRKSEKESLCGKSTETQEESTQNIKQQINQAIKNLQPKTSRWNNKKTFRTSSPLDIALSRQFDKNKLNNFINRQKQYEIHKRQRIEYVAECIKHTGSPKINTKSKEIAERLGNFSTRMNNPKVVKLKSTKLDTYHNKKLNTSKEYERVKSRLQLRDNVDTLLKRIKKENEVKEAVARKAKYEQQVQEIIECTHKPQISSMPKYLDRRHRSPEPSTKVCRYSNKKLK